MQSATRIFVFRLRQLLTILVLIVLVVFAAVFAISHFHPTKKDVQTSPASAYTAGVYTSSITLGSQSVDVQVIVDQDRIRSASIVNLDASAAAMYPLLSTSMEAISDQLAAGVSVEDISYSSSSRYTSQVLLSAISQALEKAH